MLGKRSKGKKFSLFLFLEFIYFLRDLWMDHILHVFVMGECSGLFWNSELRSVCTNKLYV